MGGVLVDMFLGGVRGWGGSTAAIAFPCFKAFFVDGRLFTGPLTVAVILDDDARTR
jgi:hypothetical protein